MNRIYIHYNLSQSISYHFYLNLPFFFPNKIKITIIHISGNLFQFSLLPINAKNRWIKNSGKPNYFCLYKDEKVIYVSSFHTWYVKWHDRKKVMSVWIHHLPFFISLSSFSSSGITYDWIDMVIVIFAKRKKGKGMLFMAELKVLNEIGRTLLQWQL